MKQYNPVFTRAILKDTVKEKLLKNWLLLFEANSEMKKNN